MAEPMGMLRESGRMIFIPRPHQLAARDAILAARLEGWPGFLLGDLTGLGKTLSVWAALAAMPEDDILVVWPQRWDAAVAPNHGAEWAPAKKGDADQLRAHEIPFHSASFQHPTVGPGQEQRARPARSA